VSRPTEGAPKNSNRRGWKAERLLVAGRVRVVRVGPHSVGAVVRGDSGTYECGWRNGWWWCACRSRSRVCSHVLAVRLVVDPPVTATTLDEDQAAAL
jgi:uncharacterized Zn finger protein